MASYVSSGYSTPQGVTSRDAVKEMQAQLGVKTDGIWGPKTQAAYDAQQRNNQISQIQSMIGGMGGVSIPSVNRESLRAEIEQALRPTYDSYIESRKKQTQTNRGEIDVDAASRGIGRSTWVTDAKTRQMDSEADDIAGYESQYAGAIAGAINDAVAARQALGLQAAQMNMAGQAQQAQLLMQLMGMQQQYAPTYSSSRGGGGSYGDAVAKALSTIPVAGTPTLAGNKKVTTPSGKTVQILKGH